MAHGARLASAVMFVRDLDRSVSFYHELLALDTAEPSPTAAPLVSQDGSHLILRAMGRSGSAFAGVARPLQGPIPDG
jgi:catechol 2,3-dioxygenase-like lactoylglutathione lyase family enzyme